jgi:hypothetical protein
MERSYSSNENLDHFSKPIAELNIQEIQRKYTDKNKNSKNNFYCNENSIDTIHINDKNAYNQNDLYKDKNLESNDNYKHNRRISKSSEKKRVYNKQFNFNSSGNSNKEISNNTINLSKDIKDFYCNTSDVISEEGLSVFNENLSDCPRNQKTHNSNQFEKDVKNINLEIESKYNFINKDLKKKENQNTGNDFVLNFDPNDKNLNFTLKRNQTLEIIKEGILQKKSPYFHYNTRKVVLDSTPRIEYIDPVINKVKVFVY